MLGYIKSDSRSMDHTMLLENGRPSFLTPCESFIQLKEKLSYSGEQQDGLSISTKGNKGKVTEHTIGCTVFSRTKEDSKLAPSIKDTVFLKTMDEEVYREETTSWVAPLPFRVPRQHLPNNCEQVIRRLMSLHRTLNKKPEMKEQFVAFVGKICENDRTEPVPALKKDEECWYLPTFRFCHPQKPGQIWVAFDSSAQQCGVSLNNVLLTSPDLNNSLLGVLIRFRKETLVITMDIQKTFHFFRIRKDHRNFLRFLWYRDNNLSKDIIEYKMKVHIFRNSPSTAVAIYGLRRAAQEGAREHGADTLQFVERHFYIDNGLASLPIAAEAIDLLKRTQASLSESNLWLHEFASNHPAVMEAFHPEDHAKGLKDLDLSKETTPMQRSLGLCWEIATDMFIFAVSDSEKSFTWRGILSTVNSLFDPLGLVAPVTIQGRSLLRELTMNTCDWDTPLPEESITVETTTHSTSLHSNLSLQSRTHGAVCVF